MISIVPISPQIAMTLKAVRLRALQDTPTAFGSTYARESQFSYDEWLNRASHWNSGEKSAGYIAMDDAVACGIAAGYLDPDKAYCANLVSMWVAPTHRRNGIGKTLVDSIATWARGRGARALLLHVTSNNEPATRFYDRLGFVKTGATVPYPNDPALFEHEMAMTL